MSKGKLIVIDGTDGSGKHTQTLRLTKTLQSQGYKVKEYSFPQYEKKFGKLIAKYLNGGFGNIDDVPVEFSSMLYSLDRLDAKKIIDDWLNQGFIVVLDRYTQSNIAYNCAKIENIKEKKKFQEWILDLEFAKLGLHQPDCVIFLYVPIEVSKKLIENRPKKDYISSDKVDMHEKNAQYMKKVENEYLRLSKELKWNQVDCTQDEKILKEEEIGEKIFKIVKKFLD